MVNYVSLLSVSIESHQITLMEVISFEQFYQKHDFSKNYM